MSADVGIDLGTTFTVAAVIQGRRPTVIPNAEGQRLTPSVVAFEPDGAVLVGEPAVRRAARNPDATVFSIKRRMGSDEPLRIAGRTLTPEEVSGFILRKVKADAEAFLGQEVAGAVITVPAYFNDRQRQATRRAAVLAGVEPIAIVNEPTAAALCYGLHHEDAETILVWDLGGGTFDVSVMALGDGVFEVLAVAGDSWLGGDDFDERLMDVVAHRCEASRGRPLPSDGASRLALRAAARRAKHVLSSRPVATVRLAIAGDSPPRFATRVSRREFEAATDDLRSRMAAATRQALADARLSPEAIERVVLVGGATRMPAVRTLATALLGKEPYRYVDPDEAVALGAAIHAGMLAGSVDRVALLDVLPLSLGVEVQGGLMSVIIPRNTPVPASASRVFTTAADYQTSMDVSVLQGERGLALDNVSVGRYHLPGIPPAPRGVAKVEVTFDVETDGMVRASATDLLSERSVSVSFASTKTLDRGEIDTLVEDAGRNAGPDLARKEEIRARLRAASLADMAEAHLAEPGGPEG